MEFDSACFKVLARNDTGDADGHQGGIVIPKAIADFFPKLHGSTSTQTPTIEQFLTAELYVEHLMVAKVTTRFQYQTWGGTRPAERRLTSNLGPIRNQAHEDDILLFQRSIEDATLIRITLVAKGTKLYSEIKNLIGSSRWGFLDERPVSNTEIDQAASEIQTNVSKPFVLFAPQLETRLSRVKRIARTTAFRIGVLENFGYACALSGRMMFTDLDTSGIDAAHIVPLNRLGTNDLRNGILLAKDLHWAFDCGLIGVADDKVCVSKNVSQDRRNAYLSSFLGKQIRAAKSADLSPAKEAFAWHKANIFRG